MLIKDVKEDIIKQISVTVSFSFDAVKPYLANEGTDFVKSILGTSLYKALDEAYKEAGTVEMLAEKWRVLLPLVQRPLVYYGYLLYLPFGDVRVSDGGITVSKSENSAPASAQRVEALKNALEEIAYNSLEKLLRFLYANSSVYDWTQFKQITGLINFCEQLNEHTSTTISVKTFNKIKASLKYVEENEVRSLIFPDLYDKIKEQVKQNLFEDEEEYAWEGSGSGSGGSGSGSGSGEGDENLANHKILLDMLRPGIANKALAHALYEHRVDINNAGVGEVYGSERNSQATMASAPARNEVVSRVIERLVEAGNLYLKKAKDYLIEHADDFPLYTASEEYDVEDTTESATFANDSNNKSFGFF